MNCNTGKTHEPSHPGDDNKYAESCFKEPTITTCRFAMNWRGLDEWSGPLKLIGGVVDQPSMICSCVDLGVEDASRLAPPSPRTGEKKQTTAGKHNRRKPTNPMLAVSSIIKVHSEHFPVFRCGPDRWVHTPHTLRNHARKKNSNNYLSRCWIITKKFVVIVCDSSAVIKSVRLLIFWFLDTNLLSTCVEKDCCRHPSDLNNFMSHKPSQQGCVPLLHTPVTWQLVWI